MVTIRSARPNITSAAVWKMHEELGKFEPKFAATLKRDLEQTVPQSVSSCRGI